MNLLKSLRELKILNENLNLKFKIISKIKIKS
jgi:hypothetical protein